MGPCKCGSMSINKRVVKSEQVDVLKIGSYLVTAYKIKGDGDCALHAIFPGGDTVALRKEFCDYLQ